MKNFTKIINPAKIQVPGRARNPYPVFCKIKFKDGNLSISGVVGPWKSGNCAGGCGQIDMEFAHRDPADNDGRYSDPIRPEDMEFTDGWAPDLWLDFLDVWKDWHLNDMTPGCEHQQDWDTKKKIELINYKWTTQYHQTRGKAANGEEVPADWAKISQAVLRNTTAPVRPKHETAEIKELIAAGWIEEGKRETKTAGWVNETEHPDGVLSKPCPVCGHKYGSAWLKREVPAEVLDFLKNLPDTVESPAWV